MLDTADKETLAYIVGVALGDGNLSNPNGRAVRLRITCDKKYPSLITKIKEKLKIIAPDNKISTINRSDSCVDISCYSNDWEDILGWNASRGPKHTQGIRVPSWIKANPKYRKVCLRGLFETDGSIYNDRGYTMANFTTIVEGLANDVIDMISASNFTPNLQHITSNDREKYIVRVSQSAEDFISYIQLTKE